MLRWKLPLFKGQGYINRVIPVSGWFVLTSICWTWWRMTRSGSWRKTAAPTENAGGGVAWRESWQSQHAITIIINGSGHAFSLQKWNCKEQFRSLRRQLWVRKEGRGGIEAQAFIFRSWSNVWQIKSNQNLYLVSGYLKHNWPNLINWSVDGGVR